MSIEKAQRERERERKRERPPSTNLLPVYLPLYPVPNFLRFRFIRISSSLKHDPPASPGVIEREKEKKKKIHVHAHIIKESR